MDILDLKIFKELYLKRNITDISRDLYLSQPTVSYRLNKIQNELGTRLYSYDGRYSFTESGELFYSYCQQTIAEYDRVISKITNENLFQINLSAVANYLYLDTIFNTLLQQHIYPVIRSSSSDQALGELIDKKIDAAIVGGIKHELPGEIVRKEIAEEKIVFVYHKSLNGTIPETPIIIDEPKSGLHALVLDYLEQFDNSRIIGEVGSYADKLSLVSSIEAGAFVPEEYTEKILPENVKVSAEYFFIRKIYFLYRKDSRNIEKIERLIEKLNKHRASIKN
jgi:DNA-binding transcriptional LysR family regulator